jgi:hypothetical protein
LLQFNALQEQGQNVPKTGKKSLSLKKNRGNSIGGLYEAAPDFYVRYQTDVFGIRPTIRAHSGYRSRIPLAIFFDARPGPGFPGTDE